MNSLSNARTICPLSSAQTDTGGQKAPPSVGRASPEDRVAQKQCANCDILYADKSATVYNCNDCYFFHSMNGYPPPSQEKGTQSVAAPLHSLSGPAQPIPPMTRARWASSRSAPMSTPSGLQASAARTHSPKQERGAVEKPDVSTDAKVGHSLHTPPARKAHHGSGFRRGHKPLSPDADVATKDPMKRKKVIGARKTSESRYQQFDYLCYCVEIDFPRRLEELKAEEAFFEKAARQHVNIELAIYEGLIGLHGTDVGKITGHVPVRHSPGQSQK